jgi:pseudaminic acid cytidylyltransferase
MSLKPICIIPARGGSKRIPRKNILSFNGKPLIAWSIETAIKSQIFSKVVVSTDDKEIAEISKNHGAEVPFVRNAKLADDFATTAEVLLDALTKTEPTQYTCCLYPTAPLLTVEDFQTAFKRLKHEDADSIISITEFDFHPLRAFEVQKDNRLDFKWPENALTRSQDLPTLLHDAGAFYFIKTAAFIEQKKLVMENTIGHRIERRRAIDIDTPEDFDFAELLHKSLKADEGPA